MNILSIDIPPVLLHLLLTFVFSLIIGLEQRKQYGDKEEEFTFGTDRTFVFIGLLGFVLLVAAPSTYLLYLAGGFVLSVFLGIYYFQKIRINKTFGLTTVLLALLTYTFPLVITTQPIWLSLLYFVIVLVLSESKSVFAIFSEKIDRGEFITVAKFIVIAGIILPALPDKQISPLLNFSPYKIWLAVVVISGISYLSYILRKFVFPDAGLLLTGILGGLYSSTATTIILARKSKETGGNPQEYASAILVATAMMFLRIYVLLLIFNYEVGVETFPWFLIMFLVSGGVAWYQYTGLKPVKKSAEVAANFMEDRNPLEFKVALVFAVLYVFFSVITQYTLQNFGAHGLNLLSFIVGFTDIDPFLLNLFQGKLDVSHHLIGIITLQAIISNNVLKFAYARSLGSRLISGYLYRGFGIIIAANLIIIVLLHLIG